MRECRWVELERKCQPIECTVFLTVTLARTELYAPKRPTGNTTKRRFASAAAKRQTPPRPGRVPRLPSLRRTCPPKDPPRTKFPVPRSLRMKTQQTPFSMVRTIPKVQRPVWRKHTGEGQVRVGIVELQTGHAKQLNDPAVIFAQHRQMDTTNHLQDDFDENDGDIPR